MVPQDLGAWTFIHYDKLFTLAMVISYYFPFLELQLLIMDEWTYADYHISLSAKFQRNQWNRAKMGIFTSSEKTVPIDQP